MTMVGDAYAAPLIEELQRGGYDLSSLYAIGTGGAATNPEILSGTAGDDPAAHHHQRLRVVGDREHGLRPQPARHTRRHVPSAGRGGWCCPTTTPGSSNPASTRSAGWPATGRIPLGYFNDADATRKTFPEVAGQRVVISGDRASLEKDGTLRLFGRDSLVVNTGGEKVFVEEVEEVLRAHPGVADALVVGRPSERWGEEIVALVALRDGDAPSHGSAARRSAPRSWPGSRHRRNTSSSSRSAASGNGKADYRWAKSQAAQRVMT